MWTRKHDAVSKGTNFVKKLTKNSKDDFFDEQSMKGELFPENDDANQSE